MAALGLDGGGRAARLRVGAESGWLAASVLILFLVLTPLGGLFYFAARGSGDVWPNLIANVLPDAIRTTVLLLGGVGVLTAAIGVGAAWLVTMFRFPGKRVFEWALLLPLAVPTYIVAYAYLDVMHPIGPVQSTLRALLGIARPRDLWFPEIRSLHGAIFLLGVVLYPYVYLPVRALFLMQSAATLEVARTLGADRVRVFLRVALPLARPAIAVGVSLALMEALNDIGASEFLGIRTLTVAVYTTWVVRMSVEGAAQIALVMLAVVFALVLLERWARRPPRLFRPCAPPSHDRAAAASRRRRSRRQRRLLPADPLRLPRSRQLPRCRVMAALSGGRLARRACRPGSATASPSRRSPPPSRSSPASCSPTRCGCRRAPPRRSSRVLPRSAMPCPAPCSPSGSSCRSPRSTTPSTPSCAQPSASPPACSSPAPARR